MSLTAADIQVGRIFSAKKPRRVNTGAFGLVTLWDDRQVLYVSRDRTQVQYDSPTVRFGRKHPMVPMERFLRWAKADITAQMPGDGWRGV